MKKYIQNRWGKSEFLMHIFSLLTGTFIAQLIPFIVSPLLTRMFTPEQFGEYAIYISILSPLGVIAAGRYEMAIMLPKEDDEARSLVVGSMVITLFVAVLLALVLIFAEQSLYVLAGVSETGHPNPWMRWLPVAVIMVSIAQICTYWLNRKKAFKASASNKIFQSASFTALNLGTGAISPALGFVFSDMLSRIATVFFSFRQLFRNAFSFEGINVSTVKQSLLKYKEFPIYNSWAALLDSFSANIPILIIGAAFSVKTTGYFNFSRQIIGIPMLMIAQTISQVFYQQLYERRSKHQPLLPVFLNLTKILSLISLLYVVVVLIAGEEVFALLFGKNWAISGSLGQIIVIAIGVKFIVIPLLMSLPAVEAVRSDSFLKVIYFLCMASLYFFRTLSITEFLMVYSLGEVLVYAIRFIIAYRLVKKFDQATTPHPSH